jgi:hypothetical protein
MTTPTLHTVRSTAVPTPVSQPITATRLTSETPAASATRLRSGSTAASATRLTSETPAASATRLTSETPAARPTSETPAGSRTSATPVTSVTSVTSAAFAASFTSATAGHDAEFGPAARVSGHRPEPPALRFRASSPAAKEAPTRRAAQPPIPALRFLDDRGFLDDRARDR